MRRYKVSLVGSGGSGKTAWIKKLITGENKVSSYTATIGCEVFPLDFNTNEGKITLDIWDAAGTTEKGGLTDAYVLNSDVIILFFDSGSVESFSDLKRWIATKTRIAPNAKYIVVGNKKENKTRNFPVVGDAKLFYISVKEQSETELSVPMLGVIQTLLGENVYLL